MNKRWTAEEMRKAAKVVYLVVEEAPADEVSKMLRQAADDAEALAALKAKVAALIAWLPVLRGECDADQPEATWAVDAVVTQVAAVGLTGEEA